MAAVALFALAFSAFAHPSNLECGSEGAFTVGAGYMDMYVSLNQFTGVGISFKDSSGNETTAYASGQTYSVSLTGYPDALVDAGLNPMFAMIAVSGDQKTAAGNFSQVSKGLNWTDPLKCGHQVIQQDDTVTTPSATWVASASQKGLVSFKAVLSRGPPAVRGANPPEVIAGPHSSLYLVVKNITGPTTR